MNHLRRHNTKVRITLNVSGLSGSIALASNLLGYLVSLLKVKGSFLEVLKQYPSSQVDFRNRESQLGFEIHSTDNRINFPHFPIFLTCDKRSLSPITTDRLQSW